MSNATPINPNVAGLLGVTIACRTIKALVDKGLIAESDAFAIYEGAFVNMPDPGERADAKKILQALMPGLQIKES